MRHGLDVFLSTLDSPGKFLGTSKNFTARLNEEVLWVCLKPPSELLLEVRQKTERKGGCTRNGMPRGGGNKNRGARILFLRVNQKFTKQKERGGKKRS